LEKKVFVQLTVVKRPKRRSGPQREKQTSPPLRKERRGVAWHGEREGAAEGVLKKKKIAQRGPRSNVLRKTDQTLKRKRKGRSHRGKEKGGETFVGGKPAKQPTTPKTA